MKKFHLSDFKNGWFIGDFIPTLLSTKDFEIAIKYYKPGENEQSHYHKIAEEITAIVKGKVIMNGEIKNEGDIIIIEKGEFTDFIPLTDVITCVIKVPSIKEDKYLTKNL